MFHRLAASLLAVTIALPVSAQSSVATDRLLDALGLERIVTIMREEGMDYGADMARDLIPGGSTATWEQAVSTIYDPDAMAELVRANFAEGFGDADPAPLIAFFTSDEGARLVDLEISARQAMIDDDVETAAREAFRGLDGSADPRLQMLERFEQANDLVEANVVGAMNASYQFYLGLIDGGALSMSEPEVLSEVWGQEDETRTDTREWLFGYMIMAYGPVPDPEFADYVALSETPEGQAMNRALFAGFNTMYDKISYALGLAAALEMQGQDL